MSTLVEEYGLSEERCDRTERAPRAGRELPHSPEAEQGVLGCILLSPAECLTECVKKMKPGRAVFYDLRHQEIFSALIEMMDEKHGPGGIDIITLQARLKLRNRLEQVGGVAYLSSLADTVPSAANLGYYIEIVLEKYFLRQTIERCVMVQDRIYRHEGDVTKLLDEVEADIAKLTQEQRASLGEDLAPQYLKRAEAFAEEAWAQMFRDPMKGEPGLPLIIPFPFRIRRKECTLLSADDGAGKSTLLNYLALHLAAEQTGTCIASFEEPAGVTLWRLAAQLLGKKYLPDTDAGRSEAMNALGWLNKRFWFYDFLGISDWRDVLDAYRYAAEKHGVWLFVLDSVMRIGIADDDYATQGMAAAAFARFAQDTDSHLIFVIHENKADGKGKARVRGSKLWTANAHNVLQVERNMAKGEKVSKLEWEIQAEEQQREPDHEEIRKLRGQVEVMRKDWDTHLVLRKQRYPGSQQNGSKRFWFDRESFQFRSHWEDTAVNWLNRWKAGARTN